MAAFPVLMAGAAGSPGSAVPAALLLLADSRLPAGGHAHSGGLAAAVTRGSVHDEATLRDFLAGRLQTAGRVAAAAAARTAGLVDGPDPAPAALLHDLDGELDARSPSAPAREASRAQGRGLLRAASRAWPSPVFAAVPGRPHLAVALGVATVAAGAGPAAAASLAALQCVSGPASAAVRLLGLDPLGVTALLAALAPEVDRVAAAGVRCADPAVPLPAAGSPLLELLAEEHARCELRLFAS